MSSCLQHQTEAAAAQLRKLRFQGLHDMPRFVSTNTQKRRSNINPRLALHQTLVSELAETLDEDFSPASQVA